MKVGPKCENVTRPITQESKPPTFRRPELCTPLLLLIALQERADRAESRQDGDPSSGTDQAYLGGGGSPQLERSPTSVRSSSSRYSLPNRGQLNSIRRINQRDYGDPRRRGSVLYNRASAAYTHTYYTPRAQREWGEGEARTQEWLLPLHLRMHAPLAALSHGPRDATAMHRGHAGAEPLLNRRGPRVCAPRVHLSGPCAIDRGRDIVIG